MIATLKIVCIFSILLIEFIDGINIKGKNTNLNNCDNDDDSLIFAHTVSVHLQNVMGYECRNMISRWRHLFIISLINRYIFFFQIYSYVDMEIETHIFSIRMTHGKQRSIGLVDMHS